MISLNSTLRKLRVVLAGAITTNQLDCTAQYRDIRVQKGDMSYGANVVATNSGTIVVLVEAPQSGMIREVFTISIYNKDTANATVSIYYTDDATNYIVGKFTLSPGDSLLYSDEHGWACFNSAGDRKVS